MDLPTGKERFEIFRQCLKGHDISGLDLKALANADSIDFSGELSFKSRNVIYSTFSENLLFFIFFKRTYYVKFKTMNCIFTSESQYELNIFQGVKVRKSRNDLFEHTFPPKRNERILLYYYETSG